MLLLCVACLSVLGLLIAVWIYSHNDAHERPDPKPDLHPVPIAVIIPTLHEETALSATIARLFQAASASKEKGRDQPPAPAPTVIVVDAGRREDTSARLESLTAAHPTLHLLQYPGRPSRGAQLNYGAAQAAVITPQASILLFLHADTHLPPAWDDAIRASLSSPRPPVLGTFTLSLPPPISPALQVMLWGANRRARWGGMPYGDQGYFMMRRTFDAVGGFPGVPIMEDVELLRRVSRDGRIAVLDDAVETSPRRWLQKGVVWNTVFNQALIFAWMCRVPHETIYGWYYGRQKRYKTA
ncbi:hypothetical protein PHISP_05986 [Aspergillus sp. HF37]|nr:hypothetical protein PHISP_05986 [Aspergillus sp. HF37]